MSAEFARGYVCAVANIVQLHGETVVAKDVLLGCGKVDWSIIDEHDRAILAEAGLAPALASATAQGKDGGAV